MFILVSVGVIMGVLLRTVHRLVSSIGGEPAASPKPLLSSSSSLSSLSFHMFPSRSCLSGIHQNLWAQRATPTVPTQFWIDFLFISLLPFWGDWGSRGGKHVDTGWSQKLLFFFFRLCKSPPAPLGKPDTRHRLTVSPQAIHLPACWWPLSASVHTRHHPSCPEPGAAGA